MDYSIKSGDTLWNIAKQQYNLTSDRDIQAKIAEIAKENNITDINTIISGNSITLPGLDSSQDTSGSIFSDWANSNNNYNNFLNGGKVDDFQMFDYQSLGSTPEERGEKYGQEIEKFAQNYINQYDSNGDKSLDFNEFVNMQMESFEDMFGESPDLNNELLTMFGEQFSQLSSINNDEKYIDEYGLKSLLGLNQNADVDKYINKYDTDGDGKLSFEEYKKYNEETYKNLYGQEIDWDSNSLLEQVEENFNRASTQNLSAATIDAKEFAAFFGVVDGQDGLVDGSMTYENYNYTPQMSGFEDALDNYYDDFFNN